MTSILSHGKYRQRKDWSTNSIPTLVALEEETCGSDEPKRIQPKAPRRSSLAVGLLAGRMGAISGTNDQTHYEKHHSTQENKRRSSIAVAFLGRHNKNKDASYEVAVISEKYDSQIIDSQTTPTWHEEDDVEKKTVSTESHNNGIGNDNKEISNGERIREGRLIEKEKRRRSSLQTKLDKRRSQHRGFPAPVQVDDGNTTNSVFYDNDAASNEGNDTLSPPTSYNRQKRHSWWNIFATDNKERSRRASTQDVDVSTRIADNVAPRPFRSKSRSVDHGLAAPFDLDSLRSKVEGRFDSVERLSRDGRFKGSISSIPTKPYTVGNRDTLTSVAARFDTTPSELTSINRLNSSFIYPGQQLLVPDKSNRGDSEDGDGSMSGKTSPLDGHFRKSSNDDIQLEEELLDGLRPGSPKPGHMERVVSPNPLQSDDADPVITQRFLKINVRHITDGQGVVGGVLLVTPNAVMFDPNVSDPLVIEHGPECYGVIAPMELVVNAAIFNDIAHMRVGGGDGSSNEKVEIYYPKPVNRDASHSPGKDSLLVKDETFPELGVGSVEGCDDQESVCSSNEREGDAFPKAFDRDLVTPTSLQKVNASDSTEVGGPAISQEKPIIISGEHEDGQIDTKDSNVSTTDNKTDGSSTKSEDESNVEKADNILGKELRSLEERRKSLLDHHWAVPSKESSRSIEDDSVESCSQDITVSVTGSQDDGNQQLSKLSCHDSGIDIRDPNIVIPIPIHPIPTKKNYSDADIVLSSDWAPPMTIIPTHFTDSPPKQGGGILGAQMAAQQQNLDGVGRKKTSSVSFSVDDQNDLQQTQSGSTSSDKSSDNQKKNKMLKRLSYPLTWVDGLTGDGKPGSETESAPNTGDSNQSVFSKVFSSPITLVSELGGTLFLSKTPSEESGGSPVPPLTPHEVHSSSGRSSIGTFIRPHSSESSSSSSKPPKNPQPKLDYRSMVSIDDMPELFVSFDMKAPLFPQLEKLELIPRPARACPDPPLYLRLRMGLPIGKTIPLPSTVMSYGKNKLRPEFWFSIPKNRTDELYRFLNTWVPHLYGELDEEQIRARGFELIQNDTEWVKGSPMKGGRTNSDGEEISELTRESWEVLSLSQDDYRKASAFSAASFDQDFPIPDLIGTTEILTEEHREKLCGHLPARAEGYSWSLVFSTSQHGFSLNSLYRKMYRLESPVLIVIQDTHNNVFGALTSCSLHVSDLFYGTGESLLFKFNPSFKVFHWTGENLYFIKGNPESLSIGAGDGRFGLWLDGDLNQGLSQRCSTYANEPLSNEDDFVVKTLECWAFV